MGLFNAHAVAQQRADRIATLLQSFADGQLDTAATRKKPNHKPFSIQNPPRCADDSGAGGA
ncbi:hypothetical protein I5F87_28285, partial [Pseudomonas aeruginosa]|nr:hypothetical protein [Pseudomonas aeruginosa]